MTPWFVLSYPRSRTAWLSLYLTGAGIPTFHEAWKLTNTAAGMRALMESRHAPVVCNSDCSNIFFFDEILHEFPNAQFIKIMNTDEAILASLKTSYGDHDYRDMMQDYRKLFARVDRSDAPVLLMDCQTWDADQSRLLAHAMTGTPPERLWAEQCEAMLVQLTPQAIARDVQRVRNQELPHIVGKMLEVSSWA